MTCDRAANCKVYTCKCSAEQAALGASGPTEPEGMFEAGQLVHLRASLCSGKKKQSKGLLITWQQQQMVVKWTVMLGRVLAGIDPHWLPAAPALMSRSGAGLS